MEINAAELINAIDNGDYENTHRLLLLGADPNSYDKDGCHTIRLSILSNKPDICLLLLNFGADKDAITSNSCPNIFYAANHENPKFCSILADFGVDVNEALGKDQIHPLNRAAWSGHADTCQALLERGAKVDALYEGGTSLHWAAEYDEVATCQVLLEWGAQIDVLDNDKNTPLDRAIAHDMKRAALVLIAGGASTSIKNIAEQYKSLTRLSAAALLGDPRTLLRELDFVRATPNQNGLIDQAIRAAKKEGVHGSLDVIRTWQAQITAYDAIRELEMHAPSGSAIKP